MVPGGTVSFFDRLADRISRVDSLLCVGLDPHPEDLPDFKPEAAKSYCLRLIEATAEVAAAYKPNAAFFEALGPSGLQALKDVIAAVPPEIPVILDAKRGDIASTAKAYAIAAFQALGADAVTVNPYLGFDAVQPFLLDVRKGVFLLCKTSNPGAADLQDLTVAKAGEDLSALAPRSPRTPLYLQVAHLARTWNKAGNVGLVVGATQPDSLARIRAAAPDLWILAPGVGAQGGDLAGALAAGLRKDGLGMLVPVSRGISRAQKPRLAALRLQVEIHQAREQVRNKESGSAVSPSNHCAASLPPTLGELSRDLLEAGCIRFGDFTLKSGTQSPIYVDLRRLVGSPPLLAQVARAYLPTLKGLAFDHLAPLPYAALPIASAISLLAGWTMVYPRKEVKEYGTRVPVEGVYQPGDTVVVIDDLISTGGSKFEGIERLTAARLRVQDVVVLIDRSIDARSALSHKGCRLHAVLTLTQLLDHYQVAGMVDSDQIQAVRQFLEQQRNQP